MANILVTGGAGYIGSILVPDLVEAGHHVTVYDNFMYRQQSLNHACYKPNFNIVHGDIRNFSALKPYLQKADIVIPLAAYVGAPLCKKDPVGSESTNVHATKELLQNLSPSQYVIMPTTNSAYGSGEANHYCDENSPLRPISDYATQKIVIEEALMQRENSISYRLATVFGMSPRLRLDLLVNDFTWRAYRDKYILLFEGHFKRNYIHVRDVSKAFDHGISKFEKMRGQVYNVGLSDANISKSELCELISKQVEGFTYLNTEIGKDPDQRNYIVSNKKIEATGFSPTYSINEGICELLKGFQMLPAGNYSNV